jgi:DNA-binding PadR family transcriptional regulator
MRTLKYAILGLLCRKSMSGYDISKEFSRDLAEFWSAKHSQIYPELNRLQKEGLISCRIEISGEVLERKIYSVTKQGKADFMKWLIVDDKMESTPKDIFRLRMYFSGDMTREQQLKILESQHAQHKTRYDYLCGHFMNFKKIPDRTTSEFGDYLVLDSAVRREKMMLEWLEHCIECCKK